MFIVKIKQQRNWQFCRHCINVRDMTVSISLDIADEISILINITHSSHIISYVEIRFLIMKYWALISKFSFSMWKKIWSRWRKKKKQKDWFSIIIFVFVHDFSSNSFLCVRVFICNLICSFICFIFSFIFSFVFSSICISVFISVCIFTCSRFACSRFACLSTFKSIWKNSAFIKQISFDFACFVQFDKKSWSEDLHWLTYSIKIT